jgi:hypothetical protein
MLPAARFPLPAMFCWKLETGNWKPSAIAPCTLRVRLHPCGLQQTVFFVVGKNYRLQDIQLSKSASSKLPAISFELSAGGGRLRGSFPPNLPGVSGALPLDQPSNLTSPRLRDASRASNLGLTPAPFQPGWLASRSRLRVRSSGRRLVENTGLEPVTSWLQTRRSPS